MAQDQVGQGREKKGMTITNYEDYNCDKGSTCTYL